MHNQPNLLKKAEIASSLPLQMALYFNAYFSPWWLITHVCTLAVKYQSLEITYQVILVTIHIVLVAVECVRLYLGFVGNLMEQIPQLSGFWITTLILQFPLTAFLLLHQGIVTLPLERAVDVVQLAFLTFEIIAGFVAVRAVARQQVTKFQQLVLSKGTIEKPEIKAD